MYFTYMYIFIYLFIYVYVCVCVQGDILSCTCEVWKGLAASKVPEHQRTCRCLMSYNGMEAERLRVSAILHHDHKGICL